MLSFSAAIAILLLNTSAWPVFLTTEWAVMFDGQECSVARTLGRVDFRNMTDVEINTTFRVQKIHGEVQSPQSYEYNFRPDIFEVRILPPFPKWYPITKEWSAHVLKGESVIDLVLDVPVDPDPRPRFVVAGRTATMLWDELMDGRNLTVVVGYDQGDATRATIQSGQIAEAAAKMKSCKDVAISG